MKMALFNRPKTTSYWSAIVSRPSSSLYHFRVIWRWMISPLWYLGSLKIIENDTIRKLGYSFLFAFRSNCRLLVCIISEIKQDICKKIAFFHTHTSPSEYCHNVWCRETWMVWLYGNEESLRLSLAFSTQYRRVSDIQMGIQTDRQTDRHLATA